MEQAKQFVDEYGIPKLEVLCWELSEFATGGAPIEPDRRVLDLELDSLDVLEWFIHLEEQYELTLSEDTFDELLQVLDDLTVRRVYEHVRAAITRERAG